MYDDLLDDPEVQDLITKYDGDNKNDVPLDEFGQPLAELDEEGNEIIAPENEDKDNQEEEDEPEDVDVSDTFLADYAEDVPEIDYSPQTEFAKTLELDKLDDGFDKYVLTHLEPLSITSKDGKTIRAYTVDDVPDDFEYADQRAETKANTDLVRLGLKGDQLKQEYDKLIETRDQAVEENEKRVAQREGLMEAIQNGEFPKLEIDEKGKVSEDSKINELAEDVINYQREINKDRSPSRAISFDTALSRFKKENPNRFEDLDGSLKKEDEERTKFARRTSHSAQRSGKNSDKIDYGALSRAEFDELLNDPEFDVAKLLK